MQYLPLAGEWDFCLDLACEGLEQQFYNRELPDGIKLPGTTSEAKKGVYSRERAENHLTEPYHFEGYAWYGRDIDIPELPPYALVIFRMERTRISCVWLDGHFIGSRDSFCAAHEYDLTKYACAGKHRLTVMVSNVQYKIPGGHMTSPDTQTNWNGILGEIALYICSGVYIEQTRVFADQEKRTVRAEIIVRRHPELSGELTVCARCFPKGGAAGPLAESVAVVPAEECRHVIRAGLKLPDDRQIVPWQEYTTALYEWQTEIRVGKMREGRSVPFGFRDLKTERGRFFVGGLEVMLRGKHESLVFPLTGYAPMEKTAWENIFHTAKSYGINHYRFHTCCPPEAAFEAADELGVYLEPEIPFWGTILERREAGYAESGQEFLLREGRAILDAFGNHPSFVMFSMGNELWGSKEELSRMMAELKAHDGRHWYTQGSNDFQFAPVILPEDDFFCGVRFSENRLFRGSYAMCDAPQGHVQKTEPENDFCYDEQIRPKEAQTAASAQREIEIQYHTGTKKVRMDAGEELIPQIPVVSHEIGQYAMYPDFDEIEKYTGVLKAENFKIFRERLEKEHLDAFARAFFLASGKLAVQCYKRELETAFRSRELAGFQILDLQDFPGQGTALVGILNAFMENKGLITAGEWRRFCSDRVLMLAFPGYVYEEGEDFLFEVLCCNMNPGALPGCRIEVRLIDGSGNVSAGWDTAADLRQSRLCSLGKGSIRLPACGRPQICRVTVEAAEAGIQNEYQIYVYPKTERNVPRTALVTKDREQMRRALEAGRKVLYFAEPQNGIEAEYCTDFWCYPMFASISEQMGKEKPTGTLGLYIRARHPALALFPSLEYTTPQWWKILRGARLNILDGTRLEPIVWGIDNFARNHRLGLLYECRVRDGSLLVCHADLTAGDSAEVKWLYNSLLSYVESDAFHPAVEPVSFDGQTRLSLL